MLFFITVSRTITAQQIQSLKTPVPGDDLFTAPEVKAFQSYNFLKPDLYTGRLNVSIPIFEVKSGGITIPISLSYNASGVKIDEYASNVGMGWNLNATGNIIRIIKDIEDNEIKEGSWGEPDDDYGIYPYSYVSQKGYLRDCNDYITNNPEPRDNNAADWNNPCENRNMKIDASPDFFILNAPGISSKFYLEKTGSQYSVKDVVKNGYVYDDISRALDSSFDNIGFHSSEVNGLESHNWNIGEWKTTAFDYENFAVTNTNGIKYSFGNANDIIENISDYSTPVILSNLTVSVTPSTIDKYYYDILKSTWHLDQIEDPSTNKTVLFNYQEYQRTIADIQNQYTDDTTSPSFLNSAVYNNDYAVYGTVPDYFNSFTDLLDVDPYYFHRQKTKTKYSRLNRLHTITFDEGSVEFVYGMDRQDYLQDKALTEIIIRDFNNVIVRKVELDYDYFVSNENCSQPECKRLKLDAVIFKDAANQELHRYTLDYYNPNDLPNVKSFQQDFLGYYNNNGATGTDLKTPTLYFHSNQGKYSISPFPLSGISSQTIAGDYSISANTNSLKGLLKSITYPTGGKSEFEYENHRFMLLGHEYTAGGARIKRQKIDNGEGHVVYKNYSYRNANNTNSSGYINNLPAYGSILTRNRTNDQLTFLTYNESKFGLEMTEGAFVGYNRVIEKTVSDSGEENGYTVYEFTSPNEHPNIEESYENCESTDFGGNCTPTDQNDVSFLTNNSSYPYLMYQDNDILRGKLVSKTVYNNNNELRLKEESEHTHSTFETLELDYNQIMDTYQHYGSSEPINLATFHKSHILTERNLQTKQITTEYLEGGQKVTEAFYEYDAIYPFLTEQRVVDATGEISSENFYPFQSQVSSQPYVSTLINQNRISEPIMQVSKKDNLHTSKSQVNYDDYNGLVIPKSISVAKKATDPLIEEGEVVNRDEYGNPVEFLSKDGVYSFILWGYKKSLPIAIVKGATKSQVSHWYHDDTGEDLFDIQNASDADDSEADEDFLKIQLENLRDVVGSKALITTYTYDPMVGAKSMTDERGNTVYYQYDSHNRLKYIKDIDGNIVSENNYIYKN